MVFISHLENLQDFEELLQEKHLDLDMCWE